MRELLSQARLHGYARSVSQNTDDRIHVAALFGALVLIAAVVFGTLSYHPF